MFPLRTSKYLEILGSAGSSVNTGSGSSVTEEDNEYEPIENKVSSLGRRLLILAGMMDAAAAFPECGTCCQSGGSQPSLAPALPPLAMFSPVITGCSSGLRSWSAQSEY